MTTGDMFTRKVYALRLEVISRRVELAEKEVRYLNQIASSPEVVYDLFRSVFEDQPVELFVVIHLRTNNTVTAFEILTKGTLNSSLVHPREVFRAAILQNAASIILAHNHPSGNVEPSREDVEITKQLVEAGRIIGIPIADHIIFTEENYTFFVERNLLWIEFHYKSSRWPSSDRGEERPTPLGVLQRNQS